MRHPGLLNDVLFKIVFGTHNSEPVLRALLNALLGLSGTERIADLVILNPTLRKEYLADKGAILDVKARDHRGRQYNIEVQLSAGIRADYVKRTIFYLARFCEQLERGQSYGLRAFSRQRAAAQPFSALGAGPEFFPVGRGRAPLHRTEEVLAYQT